MTEDAINPSAYIPEEGPMSFFQRLTSAYFEPSKAFADVNRRPSWLALFIVLALLSMATAFVVATRVDQAALIRKSIESLGIQMSEEQMNQALASQRAPLARYQSMISAPVYIIVSNLVIAAIFMVLFMLAGTSLNYKKSLAVTFWGLGPPGAIESILYILILFLKDPDTIDITGGILMSNLGAFMDSKAHPIMASLAGSIDVFSFWKMALLAIGFAAISDRKLTAKKAGIGVIVLWVVYVIGKALIVGGFRSLVSR
jgi:hypothetical protein